MKTWALLGVVALMVSSTGCRKPRASMDYFEASQSYSVLVARLGDEAYVDPDMSRIETLLARVPGDSLDAAAARELLATIGKERARIAREKTAANVEPDGPDSRPSRVDSSPGEQKISDESLSSPAVGMSEAHFIAKYGECFKKSMNLAMGSQAVVADVFKLVDQASCAPKFDAFKGKLVVVAWGKVFKIIHESEVRVVKAAVDGGLAGDAGASK